MSINWYLLDENKNPYLSSIDDAEKFLLKCIQTGKGKYVRLTVLKKYKFWISTVFLSLDHGWSFNDNHTPVLFETMIFHDDEYHKLHEYQQRYCTWDEAVKGHHEIVRMVIKYIRDNNEIN